MQAGIPTLVRHMQPNTGGGFMISTKFILLAILALVIAYIIVFYNRCITLKNFIKEAFSTMDVYLKKRWDLIPNLVETVKGYATHEKGVLEEITALRNKNYTNMSNEEKMDINNQLSLGLSKLIAVAENYPDLKASENFMKLSDELTKVEEDIANSRKYYNGCVREFNTSIQTFPNNVLANIFSFKEEKLFEIDELERQNVKVSF